MKIHINSVHNGQKDHKCESGGKSFSRAENLKRHIHTVHYGHKDYKCESCGKAFSETRGLKTHIHSVHEGHKDRKSNHHTQKEEEIAKYTNSLVHEIFL